MPRKPDPENKYLSKHDGVWRVSMGVPRQLRQQLGSRLVKSLGTKSIVQARLKRDAVEAEFKQRIAVAWAALGGRKGDMVADALEFRKALEGAGDRSSPAYGYIESLLQERLREIRESRWQDVAVEASEDGPAHIDVEPSDETWAEATAFSQIAHGVATPIGAPHQQFINTLKISDRSKLDEPRALSILLDWMRAVRLPPYIENINKREAVRFLDWLDADTSLSWASKAKYFGRIKFYWSWLYRREYAKENPFQLLNLDKPDTKREDDERPYTDEEVQKLLMGKPMESARMTDVMMVAALTGARLDAVIDLKVGGLADGYFSFKAQKKERGRRHVPVHPALKAIIACRIKGKGPEDDLFPEWPAPPSTSVRQRSSYFSKRYTKYTQDLGVREEEEGRRRSKINFHSWRRWFITKLERARVREPLIAAIVGHKRPGMTLGLYSGGPEFQEAAEAIALVKLPPLDGTAVVEERAISPRRRKP